MNKPTKYEIEQYEFLKKKIEAYHKDRIKMANDFNSLSEKISKAIIVGEADISYTITTIPKEMSIHKVAFDTIITITIGGEI